MTIYIPGWTLPVRSGFQIYYLVLELPIIFIYP